VRSNIIVVFQAHESVLLATSPII